MTFKYFSVIYKIVAPIFILLYIIIRLPYYLINEPKLGGILCGIYTLVLVSWYVTINHFFVVYCISRKKLWVIELIMVTVYTFIFFSILKYYA